MKIERLEYFWGIFDDPEQASAAGASVISPIGLVCFDFLKTSEFYSKLQKGFCRDSMDVSQYRVILSASDLRRDASGDLLLF